MFYRILSLRGTYRITNDNVTSIIPIPLTISQFSSILSIYVMNHMASMITMYFQPPKLGLDSRVTLNMIH